MPKKKPPNKKKNTEKNGALEKKTNSKHTKISQARLRGESKELTPRTDRYRRWRSRAEEDRFASEDFIRTKKRSEKMVTSQGGRGGGRGEAGVLQKREFYP
jgi:hypothetical protein